MKITKLEIPGMATEKSKPATVRFAQLVRESGRPEVMVFLSDPKKNRAFMAQVKENRVITVVQNPTSKRKDFGYIGFHPQPFGVFMVFPKKLKAADLTRIVGIKYELLGEKAESEKSGKRKRGEQSLAGEEKARIEDGGLKMADGTGKAERRKKVEKPEKPPKVKPTPKPAPKPEPQKPVEKSFRVRIRRTLIQELKLEVTGENAREARANALAAAKNEDLPAGTEKVSDRVVELDETRNAPHGVRNGK